MRGNKIQAPIPSKLITRTAKQGLGPAYITGISQALEDGWDYICEMDADLSHKPIYLKDLFHWATTYDLVMGSRYPTATYRRRSSCKYGKAARGARSAPSFLVQPR